MPRIGLSLRGFVWGGFVVGRVCRWEGLSVIHFSFAGFVRYVFVWGVLSVNKCESFKIQLFRCFLKYYIHEI